MSDETSNAIEIRLLTTADIEAYRHLRLEALRDSPTAFCSSYEEELVMPPDVVLARVRDNLVFGAFADGRLIGILGLLRDERRKRAHGLTLVGMHVTPSQRRRGVGGLLLDHAIQFAKNLGGIRSLKLSVMTQNRDAARLYRSRGFESYGVEREALYVEGRYIDEEYMLLRIDA